MSVRTTGGTGETNPFAGKEAGEVTKPANFMGAKALAHAEIMDGYEELSAKHGWSKSNGVIVVGSADRMEFRFAASVYGFKFTKVEEFDSELLSPIVRFVEAPSDVSDSQYDRLVEQCSKAGLPLAIFKVKG